MSVLLTLLLLVAVCSCCCYTIENTAGKAYFGFKFDVDTTGYRNLSIDASMILNHLRGGRRPAANLVYTTGGTSFRGATGTKRTLQAIANAVRPTEPFFKSSAAFYKTLTQTPSSYIELYMGKNITTASSPEKVAVGLQWILLSYVGHEADVAYNVVGGANAVGLATTEVNDAFAVWLGYPDTLGLYKHWKDVEAWGPACAGGVVASAVSAFNQMRAATKTNQAATFKANYNKFFYVHVPTVYLRSIQYASGRVARSAAWQRLASGYLKIIQPFLKASAKPTAASLQAQLSGAALAKPATVRALLVKIAAQNGIAAKNIGLC